MKNLHKKISAVALIAVLGAPVLSQGLVISSNSSSPNKKVVSYDEFQNRIFVQRYEEEYRYNSLYLESYDKKEDINYPDRWAFVKGLKSGDLDKYRKERESIVIKVGQSYFEIYFLMPQHQRDRIIMNECAKNYDFKIILSNRSDYAGARAEMNAKIRSYFKGQPELIKQLLKEPSIYGVDNFPNAESFRVGLQLGSIKLKQGYYRYRVGDSDYIIYKN